MFEKIKKVFSKKKKKEPFVLQPGVPVYTIKSREDFIKYLKTQGDNR